MTALLIWPLFDIETPRLITSDYQVINLLASDSDVWQKHISSENKQRVLDQVYRWQIAVQAGADAINAYGYAMNGNGYDFPHWLLREEGASSEGLCDH